MDLIDALYRKKRYNTIIVHLNGQSGQKINKEYWNGTGTDRSNSGEATENSFYGRKAVIFCVAGSIYGADNLCDM